MTDAGDKLAQATREALEAYLCPGSDRELLRRMSYSMPKLHAALAAYDAGKAVREAEREYLDAVYAVEQSKDHPIPDEDRIVSESLVTLEWRRDDALTNLLAARAQAEVRP